VGDVNRMDSKRGTATAFLPLSTLVSPATGPSAPPYLKACRQSASPRMGQGKSVRPSRMRVSR
jgi:hypothetical protein